MSQVRASHILLMYKGSMRSTATRSKDEALQQITDLGGANWAPYFHPSGKKILFSSNHHTESRRVFNIFSINLDGTGLEQITYDEGFDAFPMFSPDGKQLVFSSNRNNGGTRDTNVFIAEWVE